jgi:hypothetical protein
MNEEELNVGKPAEPEGTEESVEQKPIEGAPSAEATAEQSAAEQVEATQEALDKQPDDGTNQEEQAAPTPEMEQDFSQSSDPFTQDSPPTGITPEAEAPLSAEEDVVLRKKDNNFDERNDGDESASKNSIFSIPDIHYEFEDIIHYLEDEVTKLRENRIARMVPKRAIKALDYDYILTFDDGSSEKVEASCAQEAVKKFADKKVKLIKPVFSNRKSIYGEDDFEPPNFFDDNETTATTQSSAEDQGSTETKPADNAEQAPTDSSGGDSSGGDSSGGDSSEQSAQEDK